MLLEILKILLIILIAIIVITIAFVSLTTLPKSDTDKNAIFVGAMLKSNKIEYKDESGKGIIKNPVVKIMRMVWRFCDTGDKKKHAKQNPPKNIKTIKNIHYVSDGNLYHTLDILYPNGVKNNEKLPVIIDIHGGGWMYATKDLNENYCKSLSDRGYVVFNISYRLVPDVSVKEQIQDVMLALKWISENMNSYSCDCENIILTGDSAGGMLSAYACALLQSSELRNIFNTADVQFDINTLVLTSPVAFMKSAGLFSLYTKPLWGKGYKGKVTYNFMDFDELLPYVSNMPPTYLITSSGDTLAQKQTIRLYELLKKNGTKCELANYGKEYGESLVHVFSVLEPFNEAGKAAIDDAIRFCKENLKDKVN